MLSETDKLNMLVGYKQTLRAVNDGQAQKVYLAEQCDDKMKGSIEAAVQKNDTELFYVKTMKELGNMCGIEVGASCAVILK